MAGPDPQNSGSGFTDLCGRWPRTLKAVDFAVPNSNSSSNVNPATVRLGGRSEFGSQNALTISQMQLAVNAFPTSAPLKTDVENSKSTVSRDYTFIVDDPRVPVQIGSANTQQILAFPAVPTSTLRNLAEYRSVSAADHRVDYRPAGPAAQRCQHHSDGAGQFIRERSQLVGGTSRGHAHSERYV